MESDLIRDADFDLTEPSGGGMCCCFLRVAILLLFVAPTAESAGITGFIQVATPNFRVGRGYALAFPFVTEILSFEGEYARVGTKDASPVLTLLSGSVVIMSPFEVARLRPYFTTGFGVYRQSVAASRRTSFATLEGFGVFLRLGGPVHGRFDYRFLQLRGDPLEGKQKRFYVGLTLRF